MRTTPTPLVLVALLVLMRTTPKRLALVALVVLVFLLLLLLVRVVAGGCGPRRC